MERFWEIDFVRGIGILLMLVSNFVTDLQFFYGYSNYETFWWVFARATATIFLLIAGISLTISYSKNNSFAKHFKRGLYIFGLGLIITLVTWFFIPQNFVRFGILHLIGISIILSFILLKFDKKIALIVGIFAILIGFLIKNVNSATNYFSWLGLTTNTFSAVDYFPIFPWFGVVLIGIFLGKLFYPNGKRRFELKGFKQMKLVSWIGRHSLIIYFVHQPVILVLLSLIL